jgi:hypothetical protein
MDTKAKTLQRQNKRLLLSRETVRTLTSLDLTRVDGGILKYTGSCLGYCTTTTCH